MKECNNSNHSGGAWESVNDLGKQLAEHIHHEAMLTIALRDLLDMITDNRLHGPEVYRAVELLK